MWPSYCVEIQICFNEHRSFAVVVGSLLKLILLSHIALACLFLNFHHSFSIHLSDVELLMVGNLNHLTKVQADSRLAIWLLSVITFPPTI